MVQKKRELRMSEGGRGIASLSEEEIISMKVNFKHEKENTAASLPPSSMFHPGVPTALIVEIVPIQ